MARLLDISYSVADPTPKSSFRVPDPPSLQFIIGSLLPAL